MRFTEVMKDKERLKLRLSRHDARLIVEQRLRDRLEKAGLKGQYERILSKYDLDREEVVAGIEGFKGTLSLVRCHKT
jgi:hypothetical protein